MSFVADLHIHSKFSRATSASLDFPNLYRWAINKGVQVVATGDFTHPGWVKEIEQYLEPAPENGLYQLKEEYKRTVCPDISLEKQFPVRFILSVEISCIYKKNGRTRKVHNVFYAPDLEVVRKINKKLGSIGNIESDGRPILGMDSRNLFELLLNISPDIYLIPAHIWTPWFSLFGSKSGFDTIEECFEDLTPYIFALETGLSSDPAMNWMCSSLDKYRLVSNSDAHSPSKLAREANLFDCELSYQGIFNALKNGTGFLGTVEFYPEEGKYHLDGHRKCGVCLSPEESIECGKRCPVCGKPLTLGVLYRVLELADRKYGFKPQNALPYKSLIPLETVISEVLGVGESSKKAQELYFKILKQFGSELNILSNISINELDKQVSPLFAEAISRVRTGNIILEGGYDGEYGKIHIFQEGEKSKFVAQKVFAGWEAEISPIENKTTDEYNHAQDMLHMQNSKSPWEKLNEEQQAVMNHEIATNSQTPWENSQSPWEQLNEEQQAVMNHSCSPLIVIAGPGTGKTRTLTTRIAYCVLEKNIPASKVLAVTFTNKAAEEMQERLRTILDDQVSNMMICTFHRLGLEIIKTHHELLGLPENFIFLNGYNIYSSKILEKISQCKNNCISPEQVEDSELQFYYKQYMQFLKENNAIDIDDLIFLSVQLLKNNPAVQSFWQSRFSMIAVDEFQDINCVQYELLKLLRTHDTDLLAIGDPNQAIYSFRGSRIEYFLGFVHDFENATSISLSQNYRSTMQIIEAAQCVIQKNKNQLNATIKSNKQGELIQRFCATSDQKEAEFIVNTIEALLGGTSHYSFDHDIVSTDSPKSAYGFHSFAVLFRTARQSEILQAVFQESGLPYQLVGAANLWRESIMQYWKMLIEITLQPDNFAVWQSIFTKILHIPESNIMQLKEAICQQNLLNIDCLNGDIVRWYKNIAMLSEEKQDWKYIQWLEHAEALFPELQLETEQKNALQSIFSSATNLEDALQSIILQEHSDEFNPHIEKIALMTIHASKGLEFPVVFITGCENGLIPYHYKDTITNEEEERRLFYVGMTRASELLYLTNCTTRKQFGIQHNEPSPYLADIQDNLMTTCNQPKRKKQKKQEEQLLFW